MKILFLFSLFAFISCQRNIIKKPDLNNEQTENKIVKVIFETDMCFDVDDVAALAILHVYQSKEKAEILSVSFNEVHPHGVAAIDAINTYYNRGNIPVGMYKKELYKPDFSKYLTRVSKYPNDTPTNINELKNSKDVYIDALTKSPDHSVTIVSVGFLNNLADLLDTHKELIAMKVKELVIMGGINGDDFNLVRHNTVKDSEKVFSEWPTKIVISSLGGDIITGRVLETEPDSPIRTAFKSFFDDEDLRKWGRCSWDSMAVLYAIEGDNLFEEKWNNTIHLNGGGSFPMKEGKLTYITQKLKPKDYEEIIDNMLCQK